MQPVVKIKREYNLVELYSTSVWQKMVKMDVLHSYMSTTDTKYLKYEINYYLSEYVVKNGKR
jgi:ribosomal protein L15E